MKAYDNKSKFVSQPNQFKVSISQCKRCLKRNGNESCSLYKQIPLSILINKVICDSRIDEEVK